jgi:tetratricopeptide (TPR) repeat protein
MRLIKKAMLARHLGLSFLGVMVAASPTLGQQAKTKAEYDAYMAFYNEQDLTAKAALGETFLGEFEDSEFGPASFQLLIDAYARTREWGKVLETADKFGRAIRDPDARASTFVYQNAIAAAQQANNGEKILEYGDRILAVDRSNLSVLLTVSRTIPDNLPAGDAAKERALARAFDLANRARIQAQQFFASRPDQFTESQWAAERAKVDTSIHTTLGTVHLRRTDYDRAIREYQTVLRFAPRDGNAHFQIGQVYELQAAGASRLVEQAIEEEGETGRADATVLDQLAANRERLQGDVLAQMDQAIESYARAVAVGGALGDAARGRLEILYRAKNEDSLEGLAELIAEKRSELTAP